MDNLHQGRSKIFLRISLVACAVLCLAQDAQAERKPVKILDTSSSGQTIMLTAGSRDGLKLKEALLIRREDKKLVAARVIKLYEEKSAVYIVSRYSRENPVKGAVTKRYNILYGIPLDVPELPNGVLPETDVVDELERNPQDEVFFAEDGREREPEIDDDNYTPETTVKPVFPPVDYRKTHNLTIGMGIYRNANLSQTLDPNAVNNDSTTTYTGYMFRYAYNFRTYFWMGKKIPALISVEPSLGYYQFDFQDNGLTIPQKTLIDVVPLALYLRYNHEFSILFMGYVYVGYQYNIVSATGNYPKDRLADLEGGGIAFGLGGSLVLSKVIDARLEGGNDGVFFGGVVKF